MALNESQEKVAQHRQGRALALACPGSGKTSTITERTGRLLSEGVAPINILQLTFTNKARDEMKDRLIQRYGDPAAKVFVSNFHGLCGQVLRRFGQSLGYTERMTIADTDDQIELIKQISRKKYAAKGIDDLEISEYITIPKMKHLAWVANDVRESLTLDSGLDTYSEDGQTIDDTQAWIIREYFKLLKERNQTDFSGLLSETVALLRTSEEVRARLQNRFKWIQVDEYQDTNGAQNEIVELIAGAEDNVLAVGDIDQSIYGWRGAGGVKAIEDFRGRGTAKGGCQLFTLSVNYRSTPQIVKVAGHLIRCCEKRENIPFEASKPDGDPPKYKAFFTPEDEANAIGEDIKKLVAEGHATKEIAVFYRTSNMSRLIEQALAQRQIPAKVSGGGSFYDRMEIKDCLAFLRFLCNPKDLISFSRICNKPTRGLGDVSVGMVQTHCERNQSSFLTALANPTAVIAQVETKSGFVMKPLPESAVKGFQQLWDVFRVKAGEKSVHECMLHMLQASKYEQWIKDTYEKKGGKKEVEERIQYINELVNSIGQYCADNPNATIAEYLQSISLYTNGDDEVNENGVRLMTMHGSKGLEFDTVYIIGAEEGLCPHKRAVKEREDGLEEERRLFYVAMTRARQRLRITSCMKRADSFGKTARHVPAVPSRFLVESQMITEEQHSELKKKSAMMR